MNSTTVRGICQHNIWKHVPSSDNEPQNRGIGELSVKAKLTEAEVIQIKQLNQPSKILAKQFNISRQAINDIKIGRTWKHLL